MFTVTAEPTIAFVDAFRAVLVADATLMALATGVYGHVPRADRTVLPYVVLGRRSGDDDEGAMGVQGNNVSVQVDGWGDANRPAIIEAIGSRIFALMQRRAGFAVTGFAVIEGSLHREFFDYYLEPDEDKPGSSLYRMVQRWTVKLHEAL